MSLFCARFKWLYNPVMAIRNSEYIFHPVVCGIVSITDGTDHEVYMFNLNTQSILLYSVFVWM